RSILRIPFFSSTSPLPPRSTLFPYTTLFRSTNDYRVLEAQLDGVTLHHGMEYGLVYYPGSNTQVFGYVRYVLPNSDAAAKGVSRSEEHTSELQSRENLVCRLLLEKKKKKLYNFKTQRFQLTLFRKTRISQRFKSK